MTKSMHWKSVLTVIAAFILTTGLTSAVLADSSGRSGYSGNPATHAGATCSSCHSGGPATTVSLIGPTSVAPNSTNAYTVTVTSAGQTAGGFDISTTAGTLAAGTGSKLSTAEVIQSAPKAMTAGSVSWQFNWTAPASGTATLYASGLSTNGNGSTSGDMTAKTSSVITVTSTNVAPVSRPGGPYTGTAGVALTLSGATSTDSDGTIASYAWNFGDSTTGTGVSPSHTYASAGTYTVSLTVTDNAGATNTATTTATISLPANILPVAKPGGPYTGTAGQAVAFSGSASTDSDGTIASYAWNFGDSTTGTGVAPSHAYAASGTYTVSLTVTDNRGGTNTATTTATISAPANIPPVSRPGGPYTGTAGVALTLSGATSTDSDGTIASYAWNFGDSTTGTGVSPSHTYASAGTYTVSLTVTDNAGATNTATTTATISLPANILPVAKPGGPYTGTTGQAIAFSGSASTDSDGTISSYAWNFGDSATGTGVAPSHAYAAAGTYTVSLTVTDNRGGTNTATTTATISAPANVPPVARPGGPYTGTAGVALTLSGATSTDSDGTIASYAWNFGDSTTGTGVSPSHTYASAGTYTVSLTVTDNAGATNTATTTATISLPANILPVAKPGGPYTGTAGQAVAFSGSASTDSDGTIASYAWNFGDSTTGTGVAPSHAYATAGTYTVSLTVTDNRGGTNTATTTATISAPANVPPVSRPGGPYTGTTGVALTLSGATSTDSDGTIANYSWNFGDSTTGTGVSPSHTYASAGTYTVSLTVTDNGGATNTATTTATISLPANILPVAKPGGPYTGTTGQAVAFSGSASTDSDGTIASYAWNFGDSATGTGVAPSHAYAASGTYTVSLTVTDNRGGTNTATTTATISAPANIPPVSRPGGPYTGTAGVALTLSGATSSDSDGIIASYAWNFGDSTTGTGVKPSHTYASAGTYTVSLTVTDNGGATNTATTTATISMSANILPVAKPGGPYTGTTGQAVVFSGSASTDSDGTIASYAWNFGDSATGTGVAPSHAYATAGTYTVRLTVTDNRGGINTATTTATISTPVNVPPVSRPGGPYTGTVGQAIVFSGAASTDSDGTISSYVWNFGDSTTGTGVSPSHTYASAGTYTVSLTVTDNRGAKGTASTSCEVTPPSLNKAPSVRTIKVGGVNRTYAIGYGAITALGSTNPTAYGMVWNKTGSPKIGDGFSKFTNKGATRKIGTFTSLMGGLTSNTKYYVRAYATNKSGTSYGAEITFTTSRNYGDDGEHDDNRSSSKVITSSTTTGATASNSATVVNSTQTYVVTTLVPVDIQLQLKPGWNLLSLPFATDSDSTPESVLVDEKGKPVFSGVILANDPTTSNNTPVKGSIPADQGFWAYNPTAKTVTTVSISGMPPSGNASLEVGWNLIGVSHSMTANDIDPDRTVVDVREWDPSTKKYISLSSDAMLNPGLGYWIECSE